MEWIDDQSCVLIFPTNATCHKALTAFRKSQTEEPDFDDCYTAKPVPVVLWPAEDRINKTLGASEGLAGSLVVRVARKGDRKVRGAKQRSEFYRKHGEDAGKDPNAHVIGRAEDSSRKRKRDGEDEEEQRRKLDDELDNFLHKGSDAGTEVPASPPSKMRSDYIDSHGREQTNTQESLLQRTLVDRVYPGDEVKRRRKRGGRRQKASGDEMKADPIEPISENGINGGRRTKRPKKTLQELDDELQAFLNERN